jgi:hypothetical protein
MRVEQSFRSAVKAADEIGFSHRGKTLGYTKLQIQEQNRSKKKRRAAKHVFFYWSQILKTL